MRLICLLCFSLCTVGYGKAIHPENNEMIVLEGRKASANGFLAKLKKPKNTLSVASGPTELLEEGLQVERRYENFPGLVKISYQDLVTKNSSGSKSKSFTAAKMKQAMQKLRASGLFEYVEPDWIVTTQQTPTDSAFTDGSLWGLRNTGQDSGTSGVDVSAVEAWAITSGNPNIVVGVVDSGIRYTHQDLIGNMWTNPGEIPGNGIDDDNNGYIDDVYGINAITGSGDPMDDNDHGTHCAGTIAATANDAGRIVGVAYGVRLMGLKFLGASGSGSTSDAIECINYSVSAGVDVLSNSWGGGGFSNSLLTAIEAANDAGILFIAAAGNSASDNDQTPQYPANYEVENVISVAAIDRNGNLANFSCFGASTVDLGAPGVAILSSTAGSDSEYGSFNGTSMATPHVAGVAALILSEYPSSSVIEQKNRLLNSAIPLTSLNGKTLTGGRVDAFEALNVSEDGTLEIRVSSSPNPLRTNQENTIFVSVSDLSPQTGATVTGQLNGVYLTFLDNGIAPDLNAGDGTYSTSINEPLPGASVTLTLDVTKAGKSPFNGSFDLPVVSPPANDSFANRIKLANATTSTTGTNRFSSFEADEKRNPTVAGDQTVWWEFQPSSDASVTITTSGSSFDTTLAIYSGSPSLSSMSLVGSNDDTTGLTSSVTFNALNGQSYYVQVSGYSSSTGNIVLNYPDPGSTVGSPIITTQPSDILVLVGKTIQLSVVAQGSSALNYQWYKDQVVISGATSSEYEIAAAELSDSGSYYVVVSAVDNGSTTSRVATVTVDPVGLRPVNDNFDDADSISGTSGRVSSGNSLASGETGEPNHAGASTPLQSLWYRWEAQEDMNLVVNTYGSSFDTTLAAYTGSSVDSLTLIEANDDSGGLQSEVSITALSGQVYYIAVDGYSDANGTISLNWSEEIERSPGPNDAFEDALLITGSSYFNNQFHNNSATGQSGEPEHAGVASPLQSLWWSWTAPSAGQVTISTDGSNFDTALAAYYGTSPGSLNTVASNDDTNGLTSSVTFTTVAGREYKIAVDSYGTESGNVEISMNFRPSDFASWISHYFGPGDRGPIADPDGDHIQNLIHYGLGLPPGSGPRNAMNVYCLPLVGQSDSGDLGIEFVLPETSPSDIVYKIMASGDLDDWDEISSKTGTAGWIPSSGVTVEEQELPGGTQKISVFPSTSPTTPGNQFLRLEITEQ